MNKSTFLAASMFLFLAAVATGSHADTVVIKKESADFALDIKYPQGFSDKQIDTTVKALIDETLKTSENDNVIDDSPSDAPGKNGLYINFKQMYQNKQALSLLFDISTFAKGAAHPNNSVHSLNFVKGNQVTLEQLFKPQTPYLSKIADFSRTELLKNNDFDKKWLNDGTEATAENYKNWYFTKDGLAIVFDTYQVAAYVYGPQTITIPHKLLKDMLQPDIESAVWGNQ